MRKTLLALTGLAFATAAAILPAAPAQAAGAWGAIAVSDYGDLGWAWNYDTEGQANQAAIDKCAQASCTVITTFPQCGAAAFSNSMNKYTGGYGATPSAAENSALWYSDSYIVRAAICND
ncbi:DUF4189 domain-containing protein [Nocardia seriolae]|nr:DUF4189 domain-containing protein [Nocardia seriolae]APB00359.1 hypothetical protein NS506_06323 [Nocardia seriolae]MTJ65023.1 DUF4189 domain-containing protein [Nocardia seriolae]MTJ73536.1 DUF4189 domain-containing protein [Nocardia seriolae]MTJ89840.1 DUF4189 domain-containing protein [Nocardia seriolae]MTK33815.1 DUF4189 domain-containing protein [Nocardia seriolae]